MPRGRSNKSSAAFQAGELDEARRNAEATRQQLISAIERHPKHRNGDKAWTDYHTAVSNAEAPGEMIVLIPPPAKGFFMGSTKPERQQVEQLHSKLQTVARRLGVMQEVKHGENRRSAVAATAARREREDKDALESHLKYESTRGPDGLLPEERREQTRQQQQEERNRREMERLQQMQERSDEELVMRILENNSMTYEQFMDLSAQEQTKLRSKQINEDEQHLNEQQAMGKGISGYDKGVGGRRTRRKRRRSHNGKVSRRGFRYHGMTRKKKGNKTKRITRNRKKHQKKRTKRHR